jgi:hypothetical protein
MSSIQRRLFHGSGVGQAHRAALLVGLVVTLGLATVAAVTAVPSASAPIAGTCERDSKSLALAEIDIPDGGAIKQIIPAFPDAPELLPGGILHDGPLHVVVFSEHDRIPVIGGIWPGAAGDAAPVYRNVVCIEIPNDAPIYFVDVGLEGLNP